MIKAYSNIFQQNLLAIFDTNVPEYFDPLEKDPFLKYIQKEPENYFVIERKGQIVGAGGFAFESPKEGRIVWLLIDREKHGLGVGSELMHYMEREIAKDPQIELISLMTSQHTDQFYEKLNYKTTRKEADYWFKGMHLYYMEKQLK